ncbi:hypothetical protein B0J13DRAFT_428813, partial [Dactylonectria estremocensis]
DEEPINICDAEECEDQQSSEVDAEAQADILDGRTWTDVQYATHKFVQQYLVGIHGCGTQKHQESLVAH